MGYILRSLIHATILNVAIINRPGSNFELQVLEKVLLTTVKFTVVTLLVFFLNM